MKNVAVVCGGYSKEEVISFKSAEQIIKSIDKLKYNVCKILVNKEVWQADTPSGKFPIDKNEFSFIQNGEKINFDVVFMAIHGTPGEDGKLQSYFELLNIPITTCNSFVSSLTFNKFSTKAYLQQFGIETAKSIIVRNNYLINETDIIQKLGLPIFVKPNNGGSSFGVTKVKEASQLKEAIDKALIEDTEAILEEFIEATEVTNGVYKSGSQTIVLPITEIVSKTEFFDFEAKYEGLSDEITPARLTDEETKKCQKISKRIFEILGCSGVVRIDYLKRGNTFYFMEINTVPGMSGESIIPQQVKATGMNITDFYSLLIEDAIDSLK